ncbi:MAG: bifunctional (p)ppGpp synthetase/guanosine-3',5'-bis(diphosphate) 3'-pyrophosphohydrolase, partial [Lachnospiraceae bacterium]|nr:bifunctional (p)ppGpp synthetase/guanosine-3',5'-bis(diphosphate) 3'-pyrophosphohydrolase [Lachnospiraceae bacterium]
MSVDDDELNISVSTDPVVSGEPEELFGKLIAQIKTYHPSDDLTQIRKAYELAAEAHKDQRRRSGEPYIIHPLCVALILAHLEMDKETIIAAILHDIVEDTEITLEDVTAQFGAEVALLVDGVTKLTQLSWNADKVEIQAENLRHMLLAMAKDIRVILIKLADRLHNMRTLEYMSTAKQTEKARETLEIYSPLASRLGISKIKIELDDLSLKYLEPDAYNDLVQTLASTQEQRDAFIEQIISEMREGLERAGIQMQIYGRVKHLFSIYKKMRNKAKSLDQIYDLFAVRIIVEDLKDCYASLGVIHEMYTPIPGRFKDYIAMPKPNMYQSLHTTLISSQGIPFEVQIRTYAMHRTAEYGIAAHWKYKESGSGKSASESELEKMNWLRELLEWQNDMADNREFLTSVKDEFNLFSDSVYCFTPEGDV